MVYGLQGAFDASMTGSGAAGAAGIAAFFAGFALLFGLIGIVGYIYMALTMMKTAQRLKVNNAWLAWIPIGNIVLMAKMAKMHWWPVLLLIAAIIPILNFFAIITLAVFSIIWTWKICEGRGKPGWWSLLSLIPFVGSLWTIIMWGILAWGK